MNQVDASTRDVVKTRFYENLDDLNQDSNATIESSDSCTKLRTRKELFGMEGVVSPTESSGEDGEHIRDGTSAIYMRKAVDSSVKQCLSSLR